MTDHEQGMHPNEPESTQPEVSDPTEDATANLVGDFSTGEGMVTLAGIILLAVWLIFEVITDDYSISTLEFILASGAVILPRLDRDKVESYLSLGRIMKLIGYVLALIGVVEIVFALETSAFSDIGGMTLFAVLLTYAAYVVAFLGARQIKI